MATSTAPKTAQQPAGVEQAPLWTEMSPAAFGVDSGPVQGALFAEPDPCGTLDLFGDA